MALSTDGSFWYTSVGTTTCGVSTTIIFDGPSSEHPVVWPSAVVWGTSDGGEWMAHPKTAAEIIDEFARELAVMRPA